MAHFRESIRLFPCGDVMTGRGIDQVLRRPCDPTLHEPWVSDARHYRNLAEERNGPIPAPVQPSYPWGDALDWLERFGPDARLINLETAVTRSEDWWRGKGIHYRMHPGNASVLKAAGIDCCALANNHVLDWGYTGLKETPGYPGRYRGEAGRGRGKPRRRPSAGSPSRRVGQAGHPGGYGIRLSRNPSGLGR